MSTPNWSGERASPTNRQCQGTHEPERLPRAQITEFETPTRPQPTHLHFSTSIQRMPTVVRDTPLQAIESLPDSRPSTCVQVSRLRTYRPLPLPPLNSAPPNDTPTTLQPLHSDIRLMERPTNQARDTFWRIRSTRQDFLQTPPPSYTE
ncbi:hypothetical protein JAAARDRAFT_206629 [Jaapia argillacea MUCL 33604]|uniref:Uncharacterized protein n=1 Tax=Jaapia argillacea MUCL 33604 TaxID=933084 RepID=A0A067PVM1_9AGAM|nr:hypothetical protein JAAARDRAFT_206629 [Jaapia argillacea MUCL 33604]